MKKPFYKKNCISTKVTPYPGFSQLNKKKGLLTLRGKYMFILLLIVYSYNVSTFFNKTRLKDYSLKDQNV